MLRCLIYKVHTALSGGSLFYHLVSPLSSTFFKFFKTFFSAFPRGNHPVRSPAALADDLFILPPLPRFVKHFFQIFFDLFSRSTRSGREFSAALADILRRIPHPSSLVKHFFPLFRVFLPGFPAAPLSSRSRSGRQTVIPLGFRPLTPCRGWFSIDFTVRIRYHKLYSI